MYNWHQPVSAMLNGATIISEANYGFGPRKITDGTVLVPRYEKHAPVVNGRPPIAPLTPDVDGLPDDLPDSLKIVKQFNFASQDAPVEIGFTKDYGEIFSVDQGHGWQRDLTQQNRWRRLSPPRLLPDTYMLIRTHDIWECELPNGKYVVDLSIGDSVHEQSGQNVTVEDVPLFRDVTTPQGRFAEKSVQIEVRDGRLTLEIGLEGSQTNTCLNWLRVAK